MLQATATFGQEVEEDILLIGQKSPEGLLGPNDRLDIAGRPQAVPQAPLPLVDQVVRHPIDLELVDCRIACVDRRIDQRVEIGRNVVVRLTAGCFGKPRHTHTPFRGQDEGHLVRTRFGAGQGQKRRRAIEQGK